jgi:hypothetical protein
VRKEYMKTISYVVAYKSAYTFEWKEHSSHTTLKEAKREYNFLKVVNSNVKIILRETIDTDLIQED